jgi:nitroreductase
MDLLEAIRLRKSIRSYKPDPVPKEVLREILYIATRSPSALNSQPWEITIITGKVLEDIKRGNVEMLLFGALPNPDVPMRLLDGVYKERQVELAKQIFGLMGIAKNVPRGN